MLLTRRYPKNEHHGHYGNIRKSHVQIQGQNMFKIARIINMPDEDDISVNNETNNMMNTVRNATIGLTNSINEINLKFDSKYNVSDTNIIIDVIKRLIERLEKLETQYIEYIEHVEYTNKINSIPILPSNQNMFNFAIIDIIEQFNNRLDRLEFRSNDIVDLGGSINSKVEPVADTNNNDSDNETNNKIIKLESDINMLMKDKTSSNNNLLFLSLMNIFLFSLLLII